MSPELVGKLLIASLAALVFAIGQLLYVKYFKVPPVDFTQGHNDLGEDSPVVEGLLALRMRYSEAGDHAKALEYSTKALERCPESSRIQELNNHDRKMAAGV
ncbi:MAG: hypothetical protein IPI81_00950 [Flavobacteriales bacterium]|nr:hypothetical protein [Flavobacteriales bacterium]MCC6939497.1 hypothetical protein [Flavobacteriales bacterium]